MRISEHVYLVGSGHLGFDLTDPYDCNIYLLDGGSEMAIVDGGSGLGVGQVQEQITSHGFELSKLKYLLLTHGHGDHGGGAHVWKKKMPWLNVVGTRETKERLSYQGDGGETMVMAKRHGYYPDDYMLSPCEVDIIIEDGFAINVGNVLLTVLATPGHCDGHVCYLTRLDGKKMLFAGDMIFSGGRISTQVVSDCRIVDYYESVKKGAAQEIDMLLPAHYEFTFKHGHRHFELALEYFRRLAIPPSVVT
ncbi:MAG: MBL fold metallo-hydrolase [bacterium]|jgi:hydroxyacylglutathione hydrolase